ncbi:MAG: tRNA-dihydrouridine synthase C [Paraglaciecola sp.]|jgi:tRNA-dihydrouridine synthase C
MHITLAPMQGVVDHLMRDMMTQIGGFDLCVTEFVRVVDQLMPNRVFYRLCPELKNEGRTPAGTPVKVQLLGQDPNWLAENAVRAVNLGSHGVDLNFGCPAKTVNKNMGGAILLRDPQTLYDIVAAVRKAVPAQHSVSAKMRLGFDDSSLAIENALAIAEAGADSLVIHARTKVDGYKPPAYWDWIAKIKQRVDIPIVANGEIWNRLDAQNCQIQSECENIMLGRGALAMPNLAQVIKNNQQRFDWQQIKALLILYSGYELYSDKGKYFPNRIKQWLIYLRREYVEAEELFMRIRAVQDADLLLSQIRM